MRLMSGMAVLVYFVTFREALTCRCFELNVKKPMHSDGLLARERREWQENL